MILGHKNFIPLEWTVDKDASVGDTVYFMCAKTSVNHMGHLCAVLRSMEIEDKDLYEFALAQRAAYREYAGNIVTVGRVADKPFQTAESGWNATYWRSPWYAEIGEIELLNNPINISDFRDFIKVSRTGSITKLDREQQQNLDALIDSKNHIGE